MASPPYLRRTLASIVIVVSLAADLAPTSTVEHPFASADIAAGEEITASEVDWRQVPTGLFEPLELPAIAGRAIAAGDPITESVLGTDAVEAPNGWLAVSVDLPIETVPGARVVLVAIRDGAPPIEVPGVVVRSTSSNGYSEPVGLVAIPPTEASLVASSLQSGSITVLLGWWD